MILGSYFKNGPQSDFKPMGEKIEQLGGDKICENGSIGRRGLDSTEPWYRTYYSIPATEHLKNDVYAAAAAAGFNLKVDDGRITALKDFPATSQTTPTNTDSYYNPNSDYLFGTKGSRKLEVIINRQTNVTLECVAQGSFGSNRETGTQEAIIRIDLE